MSSSGLFRAVVTVLVISTNATPTKLNYVKPGKYWGWWAWRVYHSDIYPGNSAWVGAMSNGDGFGESSVLVDGPVAMTVAKLA